MGLKVESVVKVEFTYDWDNMDEVILNAKFLKFTAEQHIYGLEFGSSISWSGKICKVTKYYTLENAELIKAWFTENQAK